MSIGNRPSWFHGRIWEHQFGPDCQGGATALHIPRLCWHTREGWKIVVLIDQASSHCFWVSKATSLKLPESPGQLHSLSLISPENLVYLTGWSQSSCGKWYRGSRAQPCFLTLPPQVFTAQTCVICASYNSVHLKVLSWLFLPKKSWDSRNYGILA